MSKTIWQLNPAVALNLTDKFEVSQSDDPASSSLYGTYAQLLSSIINPNAQIAESQVINLVSDLSSLQAQINLWRIVQFSVGVSGPLNSNQCIQYRYEVTGSSRVDLSLPTSPAYSAMTWEIYSTNSAGFRITQVNAADQIFYLGLPPTTLGVSGYVECLDQYSSLKLVMLGTSRKWMLINTSGNITLN